MADVPHTGKVEMTNFADRTAWIWNNLDVLHGLNSDQVDIIGPSSQYRIFR